MVLLEAVRVPHTRFDPRRRMEAHFNCRLANKFVLGGNRDPLRINAVDDAARLEIAAGAGLARFHGNIHRRSLCSGTISSGYRMMEWAAHHPLGWCAP